MEEEEPLSPDQQIELVCELAQQAFVAKSQSLEAQLEQLTEAQTQQDAILAEQAARRDSLSSELHSLRRALQDLAMRYQATEQDIEFLSQQKRQLQDFRTSLLKTVSTSKEEKPWKSYLTEAQSDVFSLTQELKTELSSEDYRKVTTELRRMASGEQSRTETLAKLRVLLRDRKAVLATLQEVLEDR